MQVEFETKQVTVTHYEWVCPQCRGAILSRAYKPTKEDELFCDGCQTINHKRDELKFIEQFKTIFGHYIGATIIDIEPVMDYWWDSKPEHTDMETLTIKTEKGEVYKVVPSEGVLYCNKIGG